MSSSFLLVLCMFAATAAAGCMAGEEDMEFDDADLVVTDGDMQDDAELDALLADGKADGALTYLAVARLAHNAGVSCTNSRLAIAVAVAKAESGFRPWITNVIGNTAGIDRGLWQINSHWHPEISAACALSASCNARGMVKISSYGTKWSPWWTYVNGKHLPFMSQARSAAATVCAE